MAKCGDNLNVWSGNDDQIVPMMSLGAKGVISVLSNVAPQETHDLTQLCLENRYPEAAQMQLQYHSLIDALFCEVNPIPVKKAMELLGWKVGGLRLPLVEPSEEHIAYIQARAGERRLQNLKTDRRYKKDVEKIALSAAAAWAMSSTILSAAATAWKSLSAFDIRTEQYADFPIFLPIRLSIRVTAMLSSTFPTPLTERLLDYCEQHGTAGRDLHHRPLCAAVDRIRAASAYIPVFRSGNMSIGINLMSELLKKSGFRSRRQVRR